MKILHVFPFYSIKGGGGTTWLIDQLASAQASNGHEVTVLSSNQLFDISNLNNNNSYRQNIEHIHDAAPVVLCALSPLAIGAI